MDVCHGKTQLMMKWARDQMCFNLISSYYSILWLTSGRRTPELYTALCLSHFIRPILFSRTLINNSFLLQAVCKHWHWWINSNLTVSYSWICAYTGQSEHSMILVCLPSECWVNNNDTAFLFFLLFPLTDSLPLSLSLSVPLRDFCVIFLLLISLHHVLRAVFIKV